MCSNCPEMLAPGKNCQQILSRDQPQHGKACDTRLFKLISYIDHTKNTSNSVMGEIRFKIANLVYSKMLHV